MSARYDDPPRFSDGHTGLLFLIALVAFLLLR